MPVAISILIKPVATSILMLLSIAFVNTESYGLVGSERGSRLEVRGFESRQTYQTEMLSKLSQVDCMHPLDPTLEV